MAQSIRKINQAVDHTVNLLCRGRSARRVISRESVQNLFYVTLASSPQDGRALLRSLKNVGQNQLLKKVSVPWELGLPEHRSLVRKLADPAELKKLVISEGRRQDWLDLRAAGLMTQTPYRDLTRGFADHQLLDEVRASYQGENRQAVERDLEINHLTLFQALWLVRILVYQAGELRSAAKRQLTALPKDPAPAERIASGAALAEADAGLLRLADFLRELLLNYPLMKGQVRERVAIARGQLLAFNNPAADAALRSITDWLEKRINQLETERLRRERPAARPGGKSMLDSELVHLAERRYNIAFAADGSWFIPQSGYFSAGPALRREVRRHRIEAEDVTRRHQHMMDSINEQIAANCHCHAMIEAAAFSLRQPLENNADYQSLAVSIGRTRRHYAPGTGREKFKLKLILRLAEELTRTAALYPDNSGSLRNFARAMLEMAAAQLTSLNQKLGRQIKRIATKNQLMMKIIAHNLEIETGLRTLAQTIIDVLPSGTLMHDPDRAWQLYNLAKNAFETLGIDQSMPPGYQRARQRLERSRCNLAVVANVLDKNEGFRRQIAEIRRQFRRQARALRGADAQQRKEELRAEAVRDVSELLSRIKRYNQKINATLRSAASQAVLIQHDLLPEYKYVYIDPDNSEQVEEHRAVQTEFLGQHQELIGRIAQLDREYIRVYGRQGEELGEASNYDVNLFKFRITPPAA